MVAYALSLMPKDFHKYVALKNGRLVGQMNGPWISNNLRCWVARSASGSTRLEEW